MPRCKPAHVWRTPPLVHRAWAFCIASACATFLPSFAAAAPLDSNTPLDWGPLSLHSRAPVIDNQLSYTQGRILPLPAGVWELGINFSYVNTWAQMPGYFFDGEWAKLAGRAAYGFGDGWEAYMDWALMGRSGGFLDGFIESFHSAFHVTQARRDRYPRNRLLVQTIDSHGTTTWLSDDGAGVGTADPVLGAKKRLTLAAQWPSVVAEFAVRLPVGSIGRAYGSGGFQLLADVALQQDIAWHFMLDVATGLVISPGSRFVYGMEIATVQKFLMVALEWRIVQHVMLVLQYLNQDGSAEKAIYSPLNSTTHEFALGVKWAPTSDDRLVLEVGIIENTVHDANTPDFGLSLGARFRI